MCAYSRDGKDTFGSENRSAIINSDNSSPDHDFDDNCATNFVSRSNKRNSSYRYQLSKFD